MCSLVYAPCGINVRPKLRIEGEEGVLEVGQKWNFTILLVLSSHP